MDRKFVITQLVNAVIVVVTTIIVTRLTLKGSLGISPTFKTKLKSTARRYTELVEYSFGFVAVGILFYEYVWRTGNQAATRLDVFRIVVLVLGLIYFVIGILRTIIGLTVKPPPSS